MSHYLNELNSPTQEPRTERNDFSDSGELDLIINDGQGNEIAIKARYEGDNEREARFKDFRVGIPKLYESCREDALDAAREALRGSFSNVGEVGIYTY